MRVKLRDVTPVLVGLKRVGISGLERVFALADEGDTADGERLVDLMLSELAESNYIPPAALGDYRRAVWREYRRHRGEDIRDLFDEIEVVVSGEPGPQRDEFTRIVMEVFAKHELKPAVRYEPPEPPDSGPRLLIGGEIVVEGTSEANRVASAIGRRIGDW